MRFNHNYIDIAIQLGNNYQRIRESIGTTKAYWLMKRVDIIKEKLVYDIQRELQNIIDESHRVYTDNNGSFFDDRYV